MLKISFWPYVINRLSDFSKIVHEEAEWHANRGHVTKTANLSKMVGSRYFENC